MTLTKDAIKRLKARGQSTRPSVWVGKLGLTDALMAQVNETLDAHELVKLVVQESCPFDAKEVADYIARHCQAYMIQIIGHRCVMYRKRKTEQSSTSERKQKS